MSCGPLAPDLQARCAKSAPAPLRVGVCADVAMLCAAQLWSQPAAGAGIAYSVGFYSRTFTGLLTNVVNEEIQFY